MTIYAQHYSILFGTGVATYSMNDLKAFNKQIKWGMPVQVKTVNNFPPFPYYKLNFQWNNDKIGLGLSLTHYSTGSRLHYSDYSGSISVKQLIKGNSVSLPFKINLSDKEKIDLFILFEPGIAITSDKIEDRLVIGDQTNTNSFIAESESFCFISGISCSYYYKKLHISSSVGYLIDAGGKLHARGNRKMELIDDYGKPIKTNLSGFRFEITGGIRLKGKSRIQDGNRLKQSQKTKFWEWLFNSGVRYYPNPVHRPF